jgi:hypothetical protein
VRQLADETHGVAQEHVLVWRRDLCLPMALKMS